MTLVIIIITCIVSFFAFRDQMLTGKLIFNPYIIDRNKQWYRFISSGFIHADAIHLIINMYVLYSFGTMTEFYYSMAFGEKARLYYLLLYLGGLIFSVLPTYRKHRNNPSYNGLGASGAVSAVTFSFIIFDPMQKLCLYGLHFLCLPGVLFAILYLVYCFYMDKKGRDNINHGAHMWGAIYGFVLTIIFNPSLFLGFIDKLQDAY
jgi:membrane associated rhomboid family serine protease